MDNLQWKIIFYVVNNIRKMMTGENEAKLETVEVTSYTVSYIVLVFVNANERQM